MPLMQVDDAVALIRMEYAELPGLKLTFWQAQRLWNLSNDVCAHALKTLTESGFLARTVDGAYVRRPWSPTPDDAGSISTSLRRWRSPL